MYHENCLAEVYQSILIGSCFQLRVLDTMLIVVAVVHEEARLKVMFWSMSGIYLKLLSCIMQDAQCTLGHKILLSSNDTLSTEPSGTV